MVRTLGLFCARFLPGDITEGTFPATQNIIVLLTHGVTQPFGCLRIRQRVGYSSSAVLLLQVFKLFCAPSHRDRTRAVSTSVSSGDKFDRSVSANRRRFPQHRGRLQLLRQFLVPSIHRVVCDLNLSDTSIDSSTLLAQFSQSFSYLRLSMLKRRNIGDELCSSSSYLSNFCYNAGIRSFVGS